MTKPVMVIYAGGTIGMVPKYPDDPGSPLVPGTWSQLIEWAPQLDRLGFAIEAVSVRQPRDSADIAAPEWVEIAHLVAAHYDACRGFVVLHGTDTMAYSATALSFMLQNLEKPVVVTGAQLPIAAPRTDALQNFISALTVAAGEAAGLPVVPEVCLFFRTHLFRGCRTTKTSARSYEAFESPNYPALGEAGDQIEIYTQRVRRTNGVFAVHDVLAGGVVVIRVTPGLDPALLDAVLRQPQVRGVVLETYGAGNVPNSMEFLDVLGAAIAGGTCIVNVTQCLRGTVEQGRYQTSAGLLEQGVISGLDMTTEAALIKLRVMLAEYGDDREAIRQGMQQDLAGEQSLTVCEAIFTGGRAAGIYRSEARRLSGSFPPGRVRRAHLRLFGARYGAGPAGGDLLRAYVNVDANAARNGALQGVAAAVRRNTPAAETGELLAINVLEPVRAALLNPDAPVNFALETAPGVVVEWDYARLVIVSSVT